MPSVQKRLAVTHGLAALLCSVISAAAAASSIDLILAPRPQSYTNSCQSYALALTSGTAANSPVAVSTAAELRASEQELRKSIESIAKKDKVDPLSHAVWARALNQITSGKLKLNIEYIADIEKFYTRIDSLTGVKDAAVLAPAFASSLVKAPVMTSVVTVGNDKYAGGHIVTVYGTSGPQNAQRKLLLLNPAVKVGSKTAQICAADVAPGDQKYSAQLFLEDKYALKRFDGKYLLMWVSHP